MTVPIPADVAGALGVLGLDHTALAVRDLEAALALYRDVLGGVPVEYAEVPQRGFRWLVLEYPGGSRVELLHPLGAEGFLQRFLEARGEGAHHLTFLVADLRAAVSRAQERGLRVVDESHADPHWREAFISPRSAFGTIIQLAQTDLDREQRLAHWSCRACPEVGDG